ncbi:MAG: hypothetical protein KF729_12005 [Sandaracinaceae bacterium]|nr:hypothetical protein [Sandaracinaceae bacterium]
MRRGSSIAGLCCALVVGCASADGLVAVTLKSDFVPGVEAARVDVELTDAAGADALRRRSAVLALDADLYEGVRVAEFESVSPGEYVATVFLRDARDAVLGRGVVRFSFDRSLVVTVIVSRACRDTACPRAGDDPSHTACLAGECVDPRCLDDARHCTSRCASDADCPPPPAECARGVCVEGACLAAPRSTACPPRQYCDAERGCQPLPEGLCANDAQCEDAIACTTDRCVGGRCVYDPVNARCTDSPGGVCDPFGGCQYPTCAGGGACTPGGSRPCPTCAVGTQSCTAGCQWTDACAPPPGAVEVACNGIDDDCNPTTRDDACPPDDACDFAARRCAALAPRLDGFEPASRPRCSCTSFVVNGAHFRAGVRGFARNLAVPDMVPGELTVLRDSSTQLRLPDICLTNHEDASFELWFENPDGQVSNRRTFTFAASAPSVQGMLPSSARSGLVCPTFTMERGAGLCEGAIWRAGGCAAEPNLGPFPLNVTPFMPLVGVGLEASGGCIDLGPTPAPGTYCVWVENPDGHRSPPVDFEVLPP